MSNKHICAICHEQKNGCCLLNEDESDLSFGLTYFEISKICALGYNILDFVEANTANKAFVENTLKFCNVLANSLALGHRFSLKINNNACFFLGKNGCCLPIKARPYYCRLYPIWFNKNENAFVLESDRCLAEKDSKEIGNVLCKLDLHIDELKLLFAEYKKEAELHKSLIQSLFTIF